MNVPFFIARRYLLSKRKKNFINIISILSMLSVAITTAALIVVLSVFNGLGDLLHSLNKSFDPDIKIEATKGKSFLLDPALLTKLKTVTDIQFVTEVYEDYAYARYRDANQIVIVKGVSNNFIEQQRIPKENLVDGKLQLNSRNVDYALVGQGVRNSLSIAVSDKMYRLQLYYIKNVRGGTLDASKLYTHKSILPGGVFSIVLNIDESYVIVPLDFSKELFNVTDKRTALEIKVNPNANTNKVKTTLEEMLGKDFKVLNQEEQHQDLYRLLKMEKLFSFLALSLLLAIGSINIFFSLMMLALDKKKDISILSAMGADQKLIRNIFLAEGALISLTGTFAGLIIGGGFCVLQMNFGIISMDMQSSITEGYPVKLIFQDFVYTMLVVSVITFIISVRPAVLAARLSAPQKL